jgi:hypothetical protein
MPLFIYYCILEHYTVVAQQQSVMANYQQTIDVDNNGFTKGKMRTLRSIIKFLEF